LENGAHYNGHITGHALVATAGAGTYSFTDASTAGANVIAAEFLLGPPPPLLTLRVDAFTGTTTLLGDVDESVLMNYYQITSPGDSLAETGWNSLADQDYEGNGPPNGSGNGWEEAGGSGSGVLAEAYLLGDSSIAATESINLGSAYNPSVNAQDLGFTYLTDVGKLFEGNVEYFTSLLGDTDLDGDVDNADIGTTAGSFTGSGGTGKLWADGDFDGDGDVDNADLGVVTGNFTGSLASNLTAAAVPEPNSIVLLIMGALGLGMGRRRETA
jgi:hypothetical protein